MLFSSLTFILVFLPLVFALYFGSRDRWKNGMLIASSLLFYAWGGVSYSIILIASILLNHFIGKKVNIKSKAWLIVGVVLNLFILITFKYLNFFIENFNLLSGSAIPLTNIKLPLGISFFTFQGLSFLVDIYRSEEKRDLRLSETTLYICFFPQLIAGPIIRYNDIIEQIRSRVITLVTFNKGIQRFIIGLFKKVVLANGMGAIADQIMNSHITEISSAAAWLGIIAYALQIYYDFSAYSDMAIGLGAIFGFKILENFNYPYISKNIREFWRRWHISLSSWFRDYLYIPLGGNQRGKYRTYVNLSIVFILTGFWHGATWSFVFWGVFHGFFMVMERLFLGDLLKKVPALLNRIYTLLVVLIAWVFFRIESFSEALTYVKHLFTFNSSGKSFFVYLDNEKILLLGLAILFSLPVFPKLEQAIAKSRFTNTLSFLQINIVIPLLFIYAIILLSGSTYNPFIYFRF